MRRALLLAALAPLVIAARHRAVRHAPPPRIDHVFVVVMENQDYDAVLQRPFAARLAREGALLANAHCVAHPSLPNYIALASGNTWGIQDDAIRELDVRHVGDLLDARRLSWRVYAEQYPGDCYLGHDAANDLYVRRHVPFLEFKDVITDSARCSSHILNATQLDADIATASLPSFAVYVPDQQHNGHDSDVDTADAWLESRFGPLLRDARFTRNTLFVLTWDESRTFASTHIATILWGEGVRRGTTSMRSYDHYDLLRTIEEIFHLGTLGQQDLKTGERIGDVLVN